MARYSPPFTDPHIIDLARRRNMLEPGETVTDGIRRVATCLADIDRTISGERNEAPSSRFAADLLDAMLAGRVAPSSQLFSSAGRSSAVAACTVLPSCGRSDAGRIERLIAEATAASSLGMGCGMDLSELDDPATALRQINAAVFRVNQRLIDEDRRPPALMVTCSSDHPRIGEFISAKRGVDFSEWVANISVRVGADDVAWRALRPILAAEAHRNGEPGVLFQDEADRDNPTPEIEMVSTAPCAEVFLAPGERCVFLTVNLAAHVRDGQLDWEAFRRSVALAVRAGDAAVEMAAVDASPVVADRRRIGIGVCGFHTALIMMGIPYAAGARLAGEISETLTFTAHATSTDLAEARGAFSRWSGSRWQDPGWIVRKAARRVGAIAEHQWAALHERQLRVGVRNAAIVAYPPTGVVAAILGVSRSYEPHFTLVGRTGTASRSHLRVAPEVARELDLRTPLNPMDPMGPGADLLDPASGHQLVDARIDDVLACARQLPPAIHLDIHAAFSGLADESGSKTVNLPKTATIAEVETLLEQARSRGLKGLSVFRDGCLTESVPTIGDEHEEDVA